MSEEIKSEIVPETPVKTYSEEEVAALIAGLKSNNEALLAEKKEIARKAKEAEDARQLQHQEALKNAGKMDEFEKTIRSQYEPVLKEKEERYASLASRVLGSERKAVIGSFSGDFVTPEAVEILAPFIKTEFEGDEVVTKFVGSNGEVVTTDREQFRKYLREHPAFSHLIKANAPSGGGAAGGKGNGAAPAFNDMTESERLALYKSNPAEFERQLKAQRN